MSKTVISVEHLSKYYRLGVIGGGTLREDINRWWGVLRGGSQHFVQLESEDFEDRKQGQIWALRDVNLEVKEGEILGIIGRNGAGKSSLLKILSRITAPTSGRAVISGRVGSLLEVGTGFHPELTGRENVFLNGAILGMTKAEVGRKLDEIVEFAEISKFIDTPVKRYSSGMTVRLAFAVAAHLEPEILIVDEVLAVGDAEFQKKCIGKMGDVANEGRTILFVSHNMRAVSMLCHNGVVLDSGRIVYASSAENVVHHYLNLNNRQNDSHWKVVRENKEKRCFFQNISAHNKNAEETSAFSMGDDIELRIEFYTRNIIDRIDIGVSLEHRDTRVRIFGTTTKISGNTLLNAKGRTKVHLIFPENLLAPGSYCFTLALRKEETVYHLVEAAVHIDILPARHLNPESVKDVNFGFVSMPHSWVFNQRVLNAVK